MRINLSETMRQVASWQVIGNRGVQNKVGRLAAVVTMPLAALAGARGALFAWVPVCIGCGIGLWFSLSWEPGLLFYCAAASVLFVALLAVWRGPWLGYPVAMAVVCVALGVLAAGVRGHSVATPALDFRYYGPIQGRITDIDRSRSDALRLSLDQVVLDRVSPAATPRSVRVSLHSEQPYLQAVPGQTIMMTGHLAAPEGPVEPGGFDFQRMAYFDGLGAVGYTRAPVLVLEPPQGRAQIVNRLRMVLSAGVQAHVPGDAGAFAAGVITGDRSGISLPTVEDLRASSLTHLLAISGMNMAFLTGFVFALLRYGLALLPYVALRLNTKKLAAAVALVVAAFYLALSGANVATERAFIMVAVMLGAILFDRRGLTLRSVAIAAIILLLWQPESLLEPGFQMSFAATVALIAGFSALNEATLREKVPRWVMPVFTLVLSSAIAGLATAPYGAAHFNRIADFGFFANLLTVPVMGAVVMPAGAVAALLAPFGLAAFPLWIMGLGCRWILYVAHEVAQIAGSVTAVPTPGPWVLPILTLGALWVILARGKARLAGFVPVIVAFVLWSFAERPALLISGEGALVGLLGPEGRALSAPKGAGFAAETWMENDGDLADQERAATRAGFAGPKEARLFTIAGLKAVQLKGKTGLAQIETACATADVVIAAGQIADPPYGCLVLDAALLRKTGPLAIWIKGDGVHVSATRQAQRLWMGPTKVVDVPAITARHQRIAADQ